MNIYTESELVRLELLCHENPSTLHPVEACWRDLARKLIEDVKVLEIALKAHHHTKVSDSNKCFTCGLSNTVRKFPEAFKP